jgi:hypothetical protein
MILIKVLLPAPLGPIKPRISFFLIPRLSPLTAALTLPLSEVYIINNYECLGKVFAVEDELLLVWVKLIDLFCMCLCTGLKSRSMWLTTKPKPTCPAVLELHREGLL